MSEHNGSGRTWIDDIIDRANAEREGLRQKRAAAAATVAALDADLRRIDRVLRAVQDPKPQGKRPSTASKSIRSMAPERLRPIVGAILALNQDTFTAKDILAQAGLPDGSTAIYDPLRYLREREYVGKAGRTKMDGRGYDLYRVMDKDALEKAAS